MQNKTGLFTPAYEQTDKTTGSVIHKSIFKTVLVCSGATIMVITPPIVGINNQYDIIPESSTTLNIEKIIANTGYSQVHKEMKSIKIPDDKISKQEILKDLTKFATDFIAAQKAPPAEFEKIFKKNIGRLLVKKMYDDSK